MAQEAREDQRTSALLVLYFQATLGHAHRARVRSLDAKPGIRCIGVQYADREATRASEEVDETPARTLANGVYEQLPRLERVQSALRLARELRPAAAILDCPADAVQFATGWGLQRMGITTLVRWASTREDYPRRGWKELLKRPVYNRWDGYLVTGSRAAEYLRSFGVAVDRIFVCGNPSDAVPLDRGQRTQLPSREKVFLFVGRFIWHKNLDGLLDAYELYRGMGGSFGLELAGGGSGALADRIADHRARSPGVRWLGFLGGGDLEQAYARASCLVLPSTSENWGLVVNEAMHAGLPVIVSDRCGCVPELVHDGENGFVIDPTRPQLLADAFLRMERLGAAGRAAFGIRSRALVAPFSVAGWADRTAAALRETCTRRGFHAPN